MRDSTYAYTDTGRGIAWIALVMSVLALLFAVSAYGVSRTSAREVQEAAPATTNTELQTAESLEAARIEARQELESARTSYENNNDGTETLLRLRAAKDRLRSAYESSGTSADWNRLDISFTEVENALRTGSADALSRLEQVIRLLSEDVRSDDNPSRLGE